jgi:hypothetical protein
MRWRAHRPITPPVIFNAAFCQPTPPCGPAVSNPLLAFLGTRSCAFIRLLRNCVGRFEPWKRNRAAVLVIAWGHSKAWVARSCGGTMDKRRWQSKVHCDNLTLIVHTACGISPWVVYIIGRNGTSLPLALYEDGGSSIRNSSALYAVLLGHSCTYQAARAS